MTMTISRMPISKMQISKMQIFSRKNLRLLITAMFPLAVFACAVFGPDSSLTAGNIGGEDGMQNLDAGGVTPGDTTANIEYFLTTARAERGDTVRIVFGVRTDAPLKSLAVAIDFDETDVRVADTKIVLFQDSNAAILDRRIVTNNLDEIEGSQPDEGWVVMKLDTEDNTRDLQIPLNTEVRLLNIDFKVLQDSKLGFSSINFQLIRFKPELEPEVTYDNLFERTEDVGPQHPVALAEDSLNGGGIEIVGEVGFFLRGDANFDLERNIADPTWTLAYLFKGGPGFQCTDSADANDDGIIDISDSIFSLVRLFVQTGPFPEPNEWGLDPTPDDLPCQYYDDF